MSRTPRFPAVVAEELRSRHRAMTDAYAQDTLHEQRWDPVRSRRARLLLVAIGALREGLRHRAIDRDPTSYPGLS